MPEPEAALSVHCDTAEPGKTVIQGGLNLDAAGVGKVFFVVGAVAIFNIRVGLPFWVVWVVWIERVERVEAVSSRAHSRRLRIQQQAEDESGDVQGGPGTSLDLHNKWNPSLKPAPLHTPSLIHGARSARGRGAHHPRHQGLPAPSARKEEESGGWVRVLQQHEKLSLSSQHPSDKTKRRTP